MRLCLGVLPAFSLAMICLPASAHADEPGLVRLRGSSVYTTSAYPVGTSQPLYQEPAPAPYPAPYPAPARPARPVAPVGPAAQLQGFTFEFGTRYWYSTGKLAKDLYDDPRSSQNLNSRLTYSGLSSGALEGFGRADTSFGSFIRGFAGFSGLDRGALNDEDFPPGLTPYSNTLSQQQNGKLTYGTIDFGQVVVKNERLRASLFVGFGYLNESVSAVGCAQVAGNPFICAPALDPGLLAITENSTWQYARLGLLAEYKVLDRLKLSAEVAWLPYVQITAQDTHWLRLGSSLFDISGPIPENGGGTGVQLEAIASYAVTDRVTVGVGARYWYLQTRGSTDFENVIVGFPVAPMPQPLNFTTTRYGGFAQGAYRFGPI